MKNENNGLSLGEHFSWANNFYSRFVGLLGKTHLRTGEGLIISNCKQVHMFFMQFPIDLVFCNKDLIVIHLEPDKKPWTISRYVKQAELVIELPLGTIKAVGLFIGDKLQII